MNDQIIIEDLDDRRWMRSEVFGEFVRIAKEKGLLSKGCAICSEHAEESADDFDEDVDASMVEDEELKKAYEEDKRKFAEFANTLFKKAERLTKQGQHAEAFKLERRARLIKDELRKIGAAVKSELGGE